MTHDQLKLLQNFIDEEKEKMQSYAIIALDQQGNSKVPFQGNVMEICFMLKSMENAVTQIMMNPKFSPVKGPVLVQ